MNEVERILVIDYPHTIDFSLAQYSTMYRWHYYIKGKLRCERKGGWIEGFSCGECDKELCKQPKQDRYGHFKNWSYKGACGYYGTES